MSDCARTIHGGERGWQTPQHCFGYLTLPKEDRWEGNMRFDLCRKVSAALVMPVVAKQLSKEATVKG
eukprot:13395363-Alexandrium_andersonii.AAC.1